MIDWSLVLTLLRKHGYSVARVARELKIDYGHCRRLSVGETDQPRFNTGVKMLDYAYDRLPPDEFQRIRGGIR